MAFFVATPHSGDPCRVDFLPRPNRFGVHGRGTVALPAGDVVAGLDAGNGFVLVEVRDNRYFVVDLFGPHGYLELPPPVEFVYFDFLHNGQVALGPRQIPVANLFWMDLASVLAVADRAERYRRFDRPSSVLRQLLRLEPLEGVHYHVGRRGPDSEPCVIPLLLAMFEDAPAAQLRHFDCVDAVSGTRYSTNCDRLFGYGVPAWMTLSQYMRLYLAGCQNSTFDLKFRVGPLRMRICSAAGHLDVYVARLH